MAKKKNKIKSRRSFLTLGKDSSTDKKEVRSSNNETEKVKMLTPDGQLVEIDKDILDKSKSRKVNNQEIINWSNKKYH